MQVGETVLIHGCGGVGLFGIQLAKAAGAYVIVSSSPATVELAKQLGAAKVINYKTDNFVDAVKKETNGAGVDIVCDFVGGDLIANSIPIMKPLGRMVSIVNVTGNLGAAYRSNLTLHFLFMLRARYKLNALRGLIERGLVKPVIDSVMPLKDVALAHQKLEKGGIKGKIVLQVVPD